MVSFAQLRDSKPKLFGTAADDWIKVAKEAEAAAGHIYERGQAKLAANWTDAVGQRAGAELKQLANDYEVAAATIRAVVSTLDGLAEGVEIAQQTLHSAVSWAKGRGLRVEENGAVNVEGGDAPDQQAVADAKQAALVINDAVSDANKIDTQAAAELKKLGEAVGNTDLGQVLNNLQIEAAQNQLAMIKASLPIGASPQDQAAWWNSLTPAQQAELKKAVPVELYDMKGLPPELKKELAGTGYNRVEMIRWAQKNWNNPSTDLFDNNCANFVSHALKNGGLPFRMTNGGTLDDDSWGQGAQTGWDWLDKHDYSHSASWSQANSQRDFMLKHGGTEVPVSQARPGDLIYWEQAGGRPDIPKGNVHHAAVVTAVSPDGDVHYTQHSDPRLNISLNGRSPHVNVADGNQRMVVVRLDPDWN